MLPLEPGETILYTARKHWFLLVGEVIFIGVMAIIPGVLLFAPHLLPQELVRAVKELVQFEGNFALTVFFLWSIELLALVIAFFLFWTDYYLDVWFVTSQRVIAVEQRGLFNRNISTFRLDAIQDATVTVPGVIATLLGFGTVVVSTASNESFKFSGAARPNLVKERIMSEHNRMQAEKQEVWVKSTQL